MTTNTAPRTYRGYTLRQATGLGWGSTIHITHPSAPEELISLVPTFDQAESTIDAWMDAR